eukprot:SM000189S04097  [mRNA]  locus=s189:95690:96648:+ [translate_table: standard]
MPPAALDDDGAEARAAEEYRRGRHGPKLEYLVPLVYAPILPLIRISLRSRPVLRDRVFLGAVGAALLHGGYLVTGLYDKESR